MFAGCIVCVMTSVVKIVNHYKSSFSNNLVKVENYRKEDYLSQNIGVLFLNARCLGLFAFLGAVTLTAFFSLFPKSDFLPRPVFKVLYLRLYLR